MIREIINSGKCILCLKYSDALTDEHVIPLALGCDVKLNKSVCESCQRTCNKEFEGSSLKGPNFISLLRSLLGIKGRRDAPIYGHEKHGTSLLASVCNGFPQIRIGLGRNRAVHQMQIIIANSRLEGLSYYFLPNQIPIPISNEFFEGIVDQIPEGATVAALWTDRRGLRPEHWQILSQAFLRWSEGINLQGMISDAPLTKVTTDILIEWNTERRNRFFTKICFIYAMYKTEDDKRYDRHFDCVREYILKGTEFPMGFWKHSPILQWAGQKPGGNVMGNRRMTYMLSTLNINGSLYGMIYITKYGLFCIRITSATAEKLCEDNLTLFRLINNSSGHSCVITDFQASEVQAFKESVIAANQIE